MTEVPIGESGRSFRKERREIDTRIVDHSNLLAKAIGESTPPLIGRGHRVLSTQRGWGSELAITVDGLEIKVGYRDPKFNNDRWGLGLKNEFYPAYGIRVGESDKVYRKAHHIAEQLGEHTVDATGAILHELARQQNKLSKTIIEDAKELGVITRTTVTNTEHGSQHVTYFPDVTSKKMVQLLTSNETTHEEIGDIMKNETVQELLGKVSSQAVSIIMTEQDGRPVVKVSDAKGRTSFSGELRSRQPQAREAGNKPERELPIIPNSERLVPNDYQIDVAAAMMRCAGQEFPTYPSLGERVRWSEEQIQQWEAAGMPTSTLMENARHEMVNDHPNRQTPGALKAAEAGRLDYYDSESGQLKNGKGEVIPIGDALHPQWRQMLLEGKGIQGFGFNWSVRAKAVDGAVIFPDEEGYLNVLDIIRGDTKQHALVGGFFEPGDPSMLAALFKEFGEEQNFDPSKFDKDIAIYAGPAADPRDSLISARTTNLTAFFPNKEQVGQILDGLRSKEIRGGDDAIGAQKYRLSRENIDAMFAMHPELVRLAIKSWQERTGLVVDINGRVGRPETADSMESAADVLTGVIVPEEGSFVLDKSQLSSRFTAFYERHMAVDGGESGRYGTIYNPEWGVHAIKDMLTTVNALRGEGVQFQPDAEGRGFEQIFVASAMQAITNVRERISKEGLQFRENLDPNRIDQAELELRRIGMEQLEATGVLQAFPRVEPLRVVPDPESPGKYKTEGGPQSFEVTFSRQFATLVRDFHIESATSRNGLSRILSGEWDHDPKKIIFVAGRTEKEDLFPGMEGSDVYKYTTPVEIDAIKTMVESALGRDPDFQFKKVVSLSMGAKYAGQNHHWLDDMTPYLQRQIEEGGVFLIGSTDSNLAGPLLTKIKELGGKSIGVVPEGPVVFPGYRQDNLDYAYPSAALPTDVTVVVQSGREYDGNESPYFVQIALTEALAEGRKLDIGMINGGKLSLLDEVARLLHEEAKKPRSDYPELNSTLMLVKDAGRGSQLLSVLVERQRRGEITDKDQGVDKLIRDLDQLVAGNLEPEQQHRLLGEIGTMDEARAFLKELQKQKPPFAVALRAAFTAYNEYVARHDLPEEDAVRIVTTKALQAAYS